MTRIATLAAATVWAQAAAIALAAVAACTKPPAHSTTTPSDAAIGALADAVARPPADAAVARCGTSPGPALAAGRAATAGIALADGTILLAGWAAAGSWSLIYDPASGQMNEVAAPAGFAAIRMVRTADDAAVMLGAPDAVGPATHAARFDADRKEWREVMAVPACATDDAPTLDDEFDVTAEPIALDDGSVLVVGHRCAVFLGGGGTWSRAPTPPRQRRGFTLTRLRDGGVLRVGGLMTMPDDFDLAASTFVDRYDVAKRRWKAVAPAHYMRYHHSAVRLADGRVLVVGGCEDSGTICHSEGRPAPPPEIYDPARDHWTVLGSAPVTNRERAMLTALPDGRVIMLGGFVDERGTLPPTAMFDRGRWGALPPLAADRAGEVTVAAGDHVLFGGGPIDVAPPLEWYGVAADCPTTPVELVPAPPPAGGSFP